MKVTLLVVGKAGRRLQEAVADYESRAARYWPLEVVEVRTERATRHLPPEQIVAAEGERLLQRVPRGAELIALTRTGDAWSSKRLATHLQRCADEGRAGVAFAIGGALGLSVEVIRSAQRRLRLSTYTLPHELARLVLAEQLYRAGTIARGEPYHKGAE